MKRLSLSVIPFIAATICFARLLPPSHDPKPADLIVTGISLNSITRNNTKSAYDIAVSVTIRNGGETRSNAGELRAFNTITYHSGKYPLKPVIKNSGEWHSQSLAPWTFCNGYPQFPAINAGEGVSQVFHFGMPYDNGARKGEKFYFIVAADWEDQTPESGESNNFSTMLFITPPGH